MLARRDVLSVRQRRLHGLRRTRVVIVDDVEDLRTTLGELLEVAGHEVILAREGTEAVERILDAGPDLALVDLGLPGIDGFEVARRVRSAGSARVRLVALTGWGGAGVVEQAHRAGFDRHLLKPVDVDVLLGLVASSRRPRA